ncbi:hypothetical protein N7475_000339 [Penicillium sp. IBT 31633x]|nr:hypothetical protein N7475_000339 [Penicillium sp. IBT 31633x]
MKPGQQIRWAKLIIFMAQVTQAADVRYTSSSQTLISDAMDESHMGLCVLRRIFEERPPSEHLTSGVGLLTVCYWFICAGDRLWENVINDRKYNKYDGRPGIATGEGSSVKDGMYGHRACGMPKLPLYLAKRMSKT